MDDDDEKDYVKCVALGYESGPLVGKSWCGRDIGFLTPRREVRYHEWVFQDASHALLNAREEGRLLICNSCAMAMQVALAKGTDSVDD